jgi:hypothetical protein
MPSPSRQQRGGHLINLDPDSLTRPDLKLRAQLGAHFTQRDHPDRSIVITWIGHRDRSAATLGEFTC